MLYHFDEVAFDDAPIGFSLEQSPNVGAFVVEHEYLASKDVEPLNEASPFGDQFPSSLSNSHIVFE